MDTVLIKEDVQPNSKNMASTNENIQKLIGMGIPESFIRGEIAKGKKGLAKGKNLDDKDVAAFQTQWEKNNPKPKTGWNIATANVPDALKKDPSFLALSSDMQEIVAYNYDVQQKGNAQKIQAMNQALEQATAQADPHWRSIIRIAQTEVANGLADISGDYASQNDNLKRQIGYIQEDLERNKGILSIDQQRDMASLAADLIDRQKSFELNMGQLGAQKAYQLDGMELDYRKSIDDINRNTEYTTQEKKSALDKINVDFNAARGNLIGNASDAGLTFSTKRKIAEQRLTEENRGIVESTVRTYNKQLNDLASNTNYMTQKDLLEKGNIASEFQFSTQQQQQANEMAQRKIQEERERTQSQYATRIAELETDAARGNTAAQAEMTDLKRRMESSLARTALAGEKYLGSENMPTGTPVLGGVTGSLYEDKVRDIENRKNAIYGDLTNQSLNF